MKLNNRAVAHHRETSGTLGRCWRRSGHPNVHQSSCRNLTTTTATSTKTSLLSGHLVITSRTRRIEECRSDAVRDVTVLWAVEWLRQSDVSTNTVWLDIVAAEVAIDDRRTCLQTQWHFLTYISSYARRSGQWRHANLMCNSERTPHWHEVRVAETSDVINLCEEARIDVRWVECRCAERQVTCEADVNLVWRQVESCI